MRLRRLEIVGFKSFPTRSVIEFSDGVTGIVGPNGCGKSNLVDAIRWVLGEQSPKQLRGGSMEDVLFKGTDLQTAANLAEVALTFENVGDEWLHDAETSDPLLQLLRGATEFTITRRYYRTGESEYLINKQPCRLKDIAELVALAGIGTSSYAIIEQGRVEKLILAKPDERRLFIEDAAGTALYRSRRLAAQRRMERTRENLARVQDVLRELERQVAYWRRLAKRAEEARALRDELREVELTLAERQLRDLRYAEECSRHRLNAIDERMSSIVDASDRCARALEERLAELRKVQEQVRELELGLERCQAEIAGLEREKTLVEHALRDADSRGRVLRSEAEQIQVDRASMVAVLEREAKFRQHLWSQLLATERHLHRQERGERACQRLAEQLQRERQRVVAERERVWRAEVETRNRLQRREREAMLLARRSQELREEIDALKAELVQIDADLLHAGQVMHSARRSVAYWELEVRQSEPALARSAALAADSERTLDSLRKELTENQSRLDVLEQLRKTHEGHPRGVRSLLEDRSLRGSEGVLGVVADVLDVPAELEGAVATALGNYLHCLIVRSEEQSLEAIETLREKGLGRGQFISLHPPTLSSAYERVLSLNGASRPLLQLVNVDSGFEELAKALLGAVVVAPSIREGLRLWQEAGGDITVVTPEGDAIDRQGVVAGGVEESAREQELLTRRRLLAELAKTVADVRARLQQAEAEHRVARQQWQQAREYDELAKARLREARSQLVGSSREFERKQVERQRVTDRLEQRVREFARLSDELHSLTTAMADDSEKLAELAQAVAEVEWNPGSDVFAEAAGRELTQWRERVGQTRVRVAELREQHDACVRGLARVERELARLASRAAEVDIQSSELHSAQVEQRARLDLLGRRELELREESAALRERREKIQIETSGLQDEVASLERQKRDLDVEREGLLRARGQEEIRLTETRLRIAHVQQEVQQKYGLAISTGAPGSDKYESENDAALEQRATELRRSLERVGDVGLATISELEALQERTEFLRRQKGDLERSLEDLEKTIHRLDHVSRDRFRRAFTRIAEVFHEMIPRLFAGAEAELALVEGEEGVGGGVEIFVRLPGKKLESVSLLSGGEKALVSIAFLFAIFESNPGPFCILDEVDAPLDDANVARFSELVRAIAARAQVLVVTHNKKTMLAADRLYGVTMPTPGISTVLSVSLS